MAAFIKVDAVTKDLYTALHIAAKEGQEEVIRVSFTVAVLRKAPKLSSQPVKIILFLFNFGMPLI